MTWSPSHNHLSLPTHPSHPKAQSQLVGSTKLYLSRFMSCYPLSDRTQLPSATALSPVLTLYVPGGAKSKEPACQHRRHKRCRFSPWVGKIPWRRKWQPSLVFLPGKSHGQRSLAGYSPWGCKESDMTEVTWHTCILALIPGGCWNTAIIFEQWGVHFQSQLLWYYER